MSGVRYIKRIIFMILMLISLSTDTYAQSACDKLLPIIKACADIGEYDMTATDTPDLVRRVLYTCENFEILSDQPSKYDTAGNLSMCNAEFIDDVLYDVFRIDEIDAAPENLTEYGFFKSNGYYYYSSVGYTNSFATDVKEIIKVINLDDGSKYVLFSNTRQDGESPQCSKISAVRFSYDDLGCYVSAIDTDAELSYLDKLESIDERPLNPPILERIKSYLPVAVIVLCFISSVMVFFYFILRK